MINESKTTSTIVIPSMKEGCGDVTFECKTEDYGRVYISREVDGVMLKSVVGIASLGGIAQTFREIGNGGAFVFPSVDTYADWFELKLKGIDDTPSLPISVNEIKAFVASLVHSVTLAMFEKKTEEFRSSSQDEVLNLLSDEEVMVQLRSEHGGL